MNNHEASSSNPMDDDSYGLGEEAGQQTQSNGVRSSSKGQKRKRNLTSQVWKSFSFLPQKLGESLYCECKKCHRRFLAASKYGTGNLIRHLNACLKTTTLDIGQYMISSSNGNLDTLSSKFSQENFRELLVQAIVRHDFPFSFSQYEGFRVVFNYLQPSVSHITRNTTKADIIKLYEYERNRLRGELIRCPGRIYLAMDILCVPVSTVASESTFSLGGRILDQYRSSMSPPTVEALICTRDWLFAEKSMSKVELEELTQNVMALNINEDHTN